MLIEFIKPGVKSLGVGNVITVEAGEIVEVQKNQAEFFIKHGHAQIPVEDADQPWLDVDDKTLGYLSHNNINSISELTSYTEKQLVDMPKLGKTSVGKIINALGDDHVLATD
tara:strand:+ start:893 stop:1228 length:336 start_codon:yes stop_codon:yes gene_type:complete